MSTPGIEGRLEAARAQIDRVTPEEAWREVEDGAVVVDIRPVSQRETTGEPPEGPGSVVIDRNVLEWRLDPTSGASLPIASTDLRVLVLCQQGYASSLAAQTLREVGIHRAADVVGGFDAWLEAGLPVRRP
ncbi:rhodanese-like domain-containing protein [Janibacter melonis]|uniref:rhodanese-like domain-containing protein n=1 Tax=Janibacter melonis TaxID=262209 RepID=UPI00191AF9C8|nr:rhodanese-like domain-containing protein [Janibacter melonis]